jgi:hypothetical protein
MIFEQIVTQTLIERQRHRAWTSVEADLRRAVGVKGVTNEIEIKPTGRATQPPLLKAWR